MGNTVLICLLILAGGLYVIHSLYSRALLHIVVCNPPWFVQRESEDDVYPAHQINLNVSEF